MVFNLIKWSTFIILLFIYCVIAAPGLEVRKSVEHEGDGIYSVSIGYKLISGSHAANLQIIDSLPSTIDLVRGKLVTKISENPTSEWTYHTYFIKASSEIAFTLSHLKHEVEPPEAEIRYSKDSKGTKLEIIKTAPVTVTLELPLPQGSIREPYVIAFLTIVLPILAAFFLIRSSTTKTK